MKDEINCDALVIGGGIVGLSIARNLQLNSIETILVEKNSVIGEEVSSRNSGVVHSGIYYKQGSLKASLCLRGNKLLHEYAALKNISLLKTGKLIIGENNEKGKIRELFNNGIKNSVQGLKIVEKDEIMELEPKLSKKISHGILSSTSDIIDVPSLIFNITNDFEITGGIISRQTIFLNAKRKKKSFISLLRTGDDEFLVKSKILIVACGLHSYDAGLKIDDIKDNKQLKSLNLSKGHYFFINKSPFKHLIYPLPNDYGLGIHFTPELNGRGKFGPDHIFIDELDYKFEEGIKNTFVRAISNYWDDIAPEILHEDYVGIRPKIQKRGQSAIDFSILTQNEHGIKNLFFLQGIESPGLTSALAIGEFIHDHLDREAKIFLM